MTYNPSVNDRSGEILANAMNNASLLNYQGMETLGQGIADGIGSAKQAALAVATGGTSLAASGAGQGSSSGSGDSGLISSFIQKSVENTAKLQGIQATGSAMQAILPQYGKEGMALGQALQTELGKAGNNANKMSGTIMAFMPAVENLQSRFNQQANIENYKDLYDYKASLGGPGTNTAPKLDAQYGREFYMGLRNNNRTHEQALQDMRNAGLNWAINDIERPQNQGLFNIPNPAPSR